MRRVIQKHLFRRILRVDLISFVWAHHGDKGVTDPANIYLLRSLNGERGCRTAQEHVNHLILGPMLVHLFLVFRIFFPLEFLGFLFLLLLFLFFLLVELLLEVIRFTESAHELISVSIVGPSERIPSLNRHTCQSLFLHSLLFFLDFKLSTL